MYDLSKAEWIKSRRSGNSGNCVEVARDLVESQGVVAVRDSKDPGGPVLAFAREEWVAFIDGVKGDEFHL